MKVTYFFGVASILCIFASGHALEGCDNTPGHVYILRTSSTTKDDKRAILRLYQIRGFSPASGLPKKIKEDNVKVSFQVSNCNDAVDAVVTKLRDAGVYQCASFDVSFYVPEGADMYGKFIGTVAEQVYHFQSSQI